MEQLPVQGNMYVSNASDDIVAVVLNNIDTRTANVYYTEINLMTEQWKPYERMTVSTFQDLFELHQR